MVKKRILFLFLEIEHIAVEGFSYWTAYHSNWIEEYITYSIISLFPGIIFTAEKIEAIEKHYKIEDYSDLISCMMRSAPISMSSSPILLPRAAALVLRSVNSFLYIVLPSRLATRPVKVI